MEVPNTKTRCRQSASVIALPPACIFLAPAGAAAANAQRVDISADPVGLVDGETIKMPRAAGLIQSFQRAPRRRVR